MRLSNKFAELILDNSENPLLDGAHIMFKTENPDGTTRKTSSVNCTKEQLFGLAMLLCPLYEN